MNIKSINSTITHRRELHKIAEVGFCLPKTQKYITGVLEKLGYCTKIIGKGSIIAIDEEGCKEYLLLRADMDGVPIKEETGLAFSSKGSAMHACGHDMHSAMLLGAAEILKSEKHNRRVGAILLFQAAEELLEGARDVICSGFLDKYNIIAAFTLHVISAVPFESGTVIIPPKGITAPGADVLHITVEGKAAHGSTPHVGKSAIYPAIDIISTVNNLLLHELPYNELRVLNWGKINAGVGANIVAEQAKIEGNFRYINSDTRLYFINRVQEICDTVSSTYGCTAHLDIIGGCPPLHNNGELIKAFCDKFTGINLVDSNSLDKMHDKGSLGGSEDFAHFAKKYPSVLFSVCAGKIEDGYNYPLHTSKTDFDESALKSGVSLFAQLPSVIEKSLRQ